MKVCILLLSMTVVCGQHDSEVSDPVLMRLNFGVVFKHVDTVDVVTDVWSQTFLVQLPIVDESNLRVDHVECSHFGDPAGCTHLIDLIRFIQNSSTKAVIHIHSTLRHLYSLVPEYSLASDETQEGRSSRGLFDFVGQLSHGLFGTATDSDIRSIHKTIQSMERREHTLASAWQKAANRLASFGAATNHRLDAMAQMISMQQETASDIYAKITRETSDLSQASAMLATALNRLQDVVILLDKLNSFCHSLELLSHGFLSPGLIAPGDIHRALRAINDHVRNYGNLHVLRSRVVHYYKFHDFMISRRGRNILIHVSVPLGPLATPLYLYQVQILPMVTPGSPEHATVLIDTPKYLAYHHSSPYFLEFDERPAVSQSKLLFLEDTSAVMQPVYQSSCLMSILQDNVTRVPMFCRFAVVTDSIKPRVLSLDRKHVLLVNASEVRIRCWNEPERNISCSGSCRVLLPCNCSLESTHGHVPSRLQGCISARVPVVLHAINLPLLQEFFKESELSELYSNTLLPDPMKIFVPALKIFKANVSHQIEEDKKARFELNRLVNLTKHDKEAYGSVAHSMVNDWQDYNSRTFELDFNLFSWKSWGLILVGLMAVVGFGLSVLLSYKMRMMMATMTTLSLGARVHAVPTELNYFTPTMRPSNKTDVFQFFNLSPDLTLDITVVLLLVVIVLVVLVKGLRGHKKSLYEFDLFLHVGRGTSGCQIWLKSFKLEPIFYTFSANHFVDSLQVMGYFWPQLLITWSTLKIRSDITNETYKLPNTVSLTWKQAWFLRKILRKSFWCVLVCNFKEHQSLVALTGPEAPAYRNENAVSLSSLKTNVSAPALYPNLGEEQAETSF